MVPGSAEKNLDSRKRAGERPTQDDLLARFQREKPTRVHRSRQRATSTFTKPTLLTSRFLTVDVGNLGTVARKGGFRCRCLPRLSRIGPGRCDPWSCGDELRTSRTSLSISPRTSEVIPAGRLKRWGRSPNGATATTNC